MKMKQQVVLTTDEVIAIIKKVVENKTKKKIQSSAVPKLVSGAKDDDAWVFSLEDATVEEGPTSPPTDKKV